MEDFWPQVLETIKGQVNINSFETWIKPIHCQSIDDKKLILEVPNNFFRDWVAEHYVQTIKGVLFELTGKDYTVSLLVKKVKPPHLKEAPAADDRGGDDDLASRMFNPRYTFDNFVIGAGNQFAHAASQAVADTPGRRYNPLFVYGGVGLGKTHLLNAVGHRIIKTRTVSDPTKVCYLSSEEFTNELVNSIRFERMDGFRKKFRSIEVLLIDDIQFIAGKERTQIEFFHTFNSLYENKKQIVLTSDKLPREIPDFEERLKSRFEWGLIADIQPPDVETKVAILKKKAELENIYIPNEVAFFLASHINSNIRILEGCLIRLGAFASLTKQQEINLEMAKEVLKNFIKDKETTITIDSIQKGVSSYFDLKPKDLRSQRRLKQVVVPRQIGMYLSRKLTHSSLIEIGEKFGGKDHSTVIHSIKKIEEKINNDPYTKSVIADLMKMIAE
ncbi:MAG: chromosomal replication initiation protein DnaA [Deltaproteobacteria bacterium RBG_16_54_11]|jgi:chromosomal replication initiator protein|nr:MAG: chromosomal replication initiation protein DnaA [Deltaproteobacteria bacterium RBG_16_54_11]